jgi:hypothetical protein
MDLEIEGLDGLGDIPDDLGATEPISDDPELVGFEGLQGLDGGAIAANVPDDPFSEEALALRHMRNRANRAEAAGGYWKAKASGAAAGVVTALESRARQIGAVL